MSPTRLTAALALSAALVLAGCGGSDPSTQDDASSSEPAPTDSGPTFAAATGPQITGEGFAFAAPEGWTQRDGSEVPGFDFAALAGDPADDDGFADNVNVIQDDSIAQFDDLDELADAAEQGLASVTTENLVIGDPVEIDGESAATITALLQQGSSTSQMTQYYVKHGDSGYVITFSYSEDRPEAERVEIARSVAAGWTWTD